MIAAEHMDYGALKLVKGEVDANLLKVHDALGAFRGNTEDTAQIKSCITLLHQVHGALQVLDFTWASVLAGVMERVACVIAEDPTRRTDWAYDTLTQSINELPKHLANLQKGEDTLPLAFIPLLNDLRVAGGESILSEAMVFSHKGSPGVNAPHDLDIKMDIRALAGRVRPVYQTGLLVWYRDARNKAALRRLMEVMIQLQQASPNEGLWCIAGEVIEKLLEGELECSTSIKLLLGQVERQIRRVMDAGPEDLLLKPPAELIKNLLYYITAPENQADSSSQAGPSYEKNTENSKSTLLFDMAAKAVKDELGWAKKKLDDFARSDGLHTQDELRAIMDVLRRVSGTLDMLGRWELRQRVRRQAGILDSMLAEESILNDPRIPEVANALLYIEFLLGDKKIQPKSALQTLPNDLTRHIQPMQEEEYHELCRAIIREIMVELTQVKDDIIAFSKEPDQCDLLSHVPGLMHCIIGALTMLSLRRPTIILKAVYHYISHELLGVRIAPTQEALDSLADVLTSVEFFLETMVESQMNLDSLLDMAEGNVITLGYLVDRIDEMVVDVGASHMLADAQEIIAQEETIILSSPQESLSLSDELVAETVAAEVAVIDEASEVAVLDEAFEVAVLDEAFEVAVLDEASEVAVLDEAFEVAVLDEAFEVAVLDEASEVAVLDEAVEVAVLDEASEVAVLDEPPAPSSPAGSIAVVAHGMAAAVSPKKDAAVMAGQNEEMVDEIIEIFVEEATEAIGIIQQYYPKWKKDSDDVGALNTFRRSFHTLKGSGRLVGANVVGELSWAVENLLNAIIEGEASVSPAIFAYLEECLTVVPELVEKFQITRAKEEISDDIQALIDQSKVLMAMPGTPSAFELPIIDVVESLTLMAVQEESAVAAAAHEVIDVAEFIEAVDVPEFKPSVVSEEIPGIDPVLLEIFTNESIGRLKEIRAFLDHCHRSRKSYVTEPLARNLHTLQGSAHMSGFMEIAELSDLFERHINFVDQVQRAMTDDELSALNDFIGIIDALLKLKHPLQPTPDVISVMARQRELMAKMHKMVESNYPVESVAEQVTEESASEVNILEYSEVDSEHDEMVVQIFLEEAAEILENTEIALQQWMMAPGMMAPMARLERELHTFKGGARMARIAPMGDLSHSVESLLGAIVAGTIEVTDEIIQLLQQSHDQLHHMLDQALKHVPVTPAVELIARLEVLAGYVAQEDMANASQQMGTKDIVSAISSSAPLEVSEEGFSNSQDTAFIDAVNLMGKMELAESAQELSQELSQEENSEPTAEVTLASISETLSEPEFFTEKISNEQVRIKAETLDNLVNQAGELSISRSRLEQQVTTLRFGLNEMKQTVSRLREKIRNLDIETEAQILSRYQEVSSQGEEFDPLEFDRFSLVQQLSRGMMEGTSDLSSIQDQFEKQVSDAEALLVQQSHMNTELQEIMMSTRLLPFSGVASRMKRLVRQISRDTGKLIDFDVIGADVEMDRTVLEKIVGPLEHMVRNAIDHGIEDSEKRRTLGKPDKGNISLSLSKEGVEMVLRMSDDGAGFNFQAIRRKAIERGLVAEREVIDDQALIQFVLASGFSTADKLTQISGRGVGMDVVNSEIKQLGGSLSIETKLGQGSIFSIRLPVALSVARALVVKEYGNVYAILNSSIDGVMRVDHGILMKAFSTSFPALEYNAEHYPIHSLHSFLEGEASSPPDEQPRHLFLMVRGGGQRAALRVDSFVESREVVVKSLGQQLGSVGGMMGATIVGNGSVVLILDIPALLRTSMADAQLRLHNAALPGRSVILANESHGKLITVMVVDDSITVRKVTSRLLERHHMRVITAKDGVDAVEVLQHHMPDVMLLDIEMPRMDGFELASVIRNDERLKHIPIIMITSRTGDKHRDHAIRIGVNKYLGKPYQEDELMENIHNLVRDGQADVELDIAV